jgi:hypothetical protein
MASRAHRSLILQILLLLALLLGAFSAYAMPAIPCFDDKNLAQLQADHPQGNLIYVWSPRMVYSVQQLIVAQQAAQSAGLHFIALHDARAAHQEIRAAMAATAQTTASMPLCAKQLLSQEALRHFPTAFILTARGIHRHAIVGAMPAAAWASSIQQRLEQQRVQP